MMPTSIVKAKPCSTSPPKKNSARTLRSVVPAVMIGAAERLVDRGVDDLASGLPRLRRMFSRTRSKMTIVSFTE